MVDNKLVKYFSFDVGISSNTEAVSAKVITLYIVIHLVKVTVISTVCRHIINGFDLVNLFILISIALLFLLLYKYIGPKIYFDKDLYHRIRPYIYL